MKPEHFEELVDAYLIGDLSGEQAAQFQEALKSDPVARAHFVQGIFVETSLRQTVRGTTAVMSQRPQIAGETGARRVIPGGFSRWRRMAVAAVALAAIAVMAVFYFKRPDSSTVARAESGSVLVDGQPQDQFPDGTTVDIVTRAVIRLTDGSVATLEPATKLTLRGRVDNVRQVLRIVAGGGQFKVPHGGGQFRVETPAGSVTVLGTEFTAQLKSPAELFVSVETGTVQLNFENSAVTLNAGQSRTFGAKPAAQPATSEVVVGFIHSVDIKAGTFVLRGKNESQTTFKVGAKTGDKRGDCLLLLDGKQTNPETAMKAGRKATVTYVKTGDELGASKVEVSSSEK